MTIMTEPKKTASAVDEYSIVNARHPGRWISAAVIVFLGLLLLRSVVTNPNFGWSTVGMYIRDVSIVRGIGVTLQLTVICMAIGIVLGVVLAVMRIAANPVVRSAAYAYVSFFRGTPVLVQLLFWYNLAALYPSITFGIPGVDLDANAIITPMTAAILGLGLNQAAYMSEIVRAGILSVENGQSEAAGALGINRLQTMRRIVLPQAMRVIIPPTGNEAIGMLKATALVSVISVPELLYSAQIIYARTFETIPLLMVASLWYIVVTSILSVGQYYVERHYAKGGQRSLPATPWQQLKRFVRVHDPLALKGAKK
ncbi:amino acid ABC transporter permease [Paeniglutamicibacter gangotriensis]|uniref:ABC transporter permease n=2 Tax=Paeniglutamicibacter gangotriensis TaxID=254787 RepID=M7NLB8_9MICC|nr:amino acid ABC transporter permease [Paeniglutamicibacter gangotriensis]EMQ99313.1 ABC transporter permease [Paeniglutamicibacter gangotriensis Lz1y]KAA0977603.1 amino acid ABC transporter permease [Paeniglutamicibacter gangotriensis]